MSESVNERTQRLGTLIRNARLHAERTTADCAHQLEVTPQTFAGIEAGIEPVSLPELELLALYLNVPMAYFWGSVTLDPPRSHQVQRYVALRQRMIGVILQQRRMDQGLAVPELADVSGVGVDRIEAAETGATAVAYVDLERLCQALELSINDLVDDGVGPLGKHEAEQRLLATFYQLPSETRAFLLNPRNSSFLDIARRLSEMDVERLRQIAEGILDITY